MKALAGVLEAALILAVPLVWIVVAPPAPGGPACLANKHPLRAGAQHLYAGALR